MTKHQPAAHERGNDSLGKYIAAANPVARFMQYVEPIPFCGCWLWTGGLIGKSGYGLFWHEGKKVVAHRWLFEQQNGPLDQKTQVCHSCDVRCCVNPAHLFAGSRSDNMKDASSKGRLKLPARWTMYPNTGKKPKHH